MKLRIISTKWLILILIFVIVSVAAISAFLSSKIDRDLIISYLESEKNIRVDIEDVSPSLILGEVNIGGIIIGPRDSNADKGLVAEQRSKPIPSKTRIKISNVSLKVRLVDLFLDKLSIKSIIIEDLDLAYSINEDGDHSLDSLLDPPKYIKGVLNPEYQRKKKRRELAKIRWKLDSGLKNPVDDSFNASEVPMPTTLDELIIKGGRVAIKLDKSGNNVYFSQLKGSITDLDVDPQNLKEHNSALLGLAGNLKVMGPESNLEYASFDLKADGTIQPFEASSGFLNPDLITSLTVMAGSKIVSLPIATRLASTLEQLESTGLDLSVIDDLLVVDNDTTFSLGLRNYILRAAEPLPVLINGNQIILEKNSWLNTANDEHLINASFTFSDKISQKAFEKSYEYLSERVGKGVASAVSELLFTPVTKKGKIHIPFVSSGDFNRPKVRPSVELKDLADAIKEGIKKDPLSILKGLLDR